MPDRRPLVAPVNRALDRGLGRLPAAARRRAMFVRAHRRWPDLTEPTTFSEKIGWRVLNDRRPQLAWTCDKLRMKEHAAASGARLRVPQTLWCGRDVRELQDLQLPEHWVLKPAHRSGLVRFEGRATDVAALAVATRRWLDPVQADTYAEWAYAQAEPALLVEEVVGRVGHPPPDYKFFVFDGVPRLVQVDVDRFTGHRRSLYTPEWEHLDVRLTHPRAEPLPPPTQLGRMLDCAARLGAGWDFMRIDLYADGDDVVFGEYTPYPGSGLERFRPRSYDAELGRHWRLPTVAGAAT